MLEPPQNFGVELRRWRISAGLSLADLADKVHYSKSHLSRVETGGKPPSVGLARRCDSELAAGGDLSALVRPAVDDHEPAGAGPAGGDHWRMTMAADGAGDFVVTASREHRNAGPALMTRWKRNNRGPATADTAGILDSFDRMFKDLRTLGQNMSPSGMVPILIGHTHALRTHASSAKPSQRPRALVAAARYAEYTGWMCQEAGDDHAALWWTDAAVRLADEAGDRDFGPYALVRQALITLYRGDAIGTVERSKAAQRTDCSPRVRGLATQREAQGWALGGDYDDCHRALDRAEALLSDSPGDDLAIGSWAVRDPVALARGWCLYDLGRPAAAAETINGELVRIPRQATRARARLGARLALAYAAADEIEQSCEVAGPVLDSLSIVDSATVRADVRDLSRAFARRHRNARVREILPRLTAALNERR